VYEQQAERLAQHRLVFRKLLRNRTYTKDALKSSEECRCDKAKATWDPPDALSHENEHPDADARQNASCVNAEVRTATLPCGLHRADLNPERFAAGYPWTGEAVERAGSGGYSTGDAD
jgi:hypothetical protein